MPLRPAQPVVDIAGRCHCAPYLRNRSPPSCSCHLIAAVFIGVSSGVLSFVLFTHSLICLRMATGSTGSLGSLAIEKRNARFFYLIKSTRSGDYINSPRVVPSVVPVPGYGPPSADVVATSAAVAARPGPGGDGDAGGERVGGGGGGAEGEVVSVVVVGEPLRGGGGGQGHQEEEGKEGLEGDGKGLGNGGMGLSRMCREN